MRWHCGSSERWGSPGAAGWEQLTRTWAPPPASPGVPGLQQTGSQGTPVPCKVAQGRAWATPQLNAGGTKAQPPDTTPI